MVEEALHTAERSMINCCVYGVPPATVYKGARRRRWPAKEGAPRGESYSHRE